MSNLTEKQLKREEIYDGVVLHVVRDEILLPDGNRAVREICLHNGAVAVIPILDDGNVIMERQYRYAHSRVVLEIPAGKLDSADEPPLDAAKRELKEETGATADEIVYLGEIVPSPALISEVIHLYMARGLHFGERKLDEGEFIEVEHIHIDRLYEMVMNGEIEDAKTQIAILKAHNLINNK